ncbi:iron chaperone [Saccharicrinis sp. FJH62]|uniref:iron chaperone n=1 Tax=Saccharicrinis sp. FJH62 TaxID=3344657 RepID=UPI0035D51593
MKTNIPQTVDEYIINAPLDIQEKLQQLREIIKDVAPNATERISYQMPAFAQNGILVYFAANKNHIGFYPTASGIKFAEPELKSFKYSKGAIQFPHDQDLPVDLIRNIVRFRLEENTHKIKK